MAAVARSLEHAISVCSALIMTYVRDVRAKAFTLNIAWSAMNIPCVILGQDGPMDHGGSGKVDRGELIVHSVDVGRLPLVASSQLRYKSDITYSLGHGSILFCINPLFVNYRMKLNR